MTITPSTALFRARELSRRIWVRTTAMALLAVVAAGASAMVAPLLPTGVAERIAPESVTRILEILASTMLAVTTFSLTVMMAARQFASSQSTPRAHRVITEESVTQSVLATFLGAFVFALTALVLMESGLFPGRAATVLLIFTVAVIVLVVIAILRWISHLTSMGGVDETARAIEDRTAPAVRAFRARPTLGARACLGDEAGLPDKADRIAAPATGYIVHIDLPALQEAAEAAGGEVVLLHAPGDLVTGGGTLAGVTRGIDPDTVLEAVTVEDARSFDQDPRYGLTLLCEIAQKALSPGVNDPGTAKAMIARLGRLLHDALPDEAPEGYPEASRVRMPAITPEDMVAAAFGPLARDAGGDVEVQVALQTMLAVLADSPDPEMKDAAEAASAHALAHARRAVTLPEDLKRVTAAAPPQPPGSYSAAS